MPYERVADRIIIQQSRISAIIWFFFLFGITIGWQWVVFGMPKNLTELMALDKGFVGKIGHNSNVDTYKKDIRDVVQYSRKTLDEMPRKDSIGKVFAIIHYIVLVISILLLIGSVYAISSSILFSLFGTTTSGKVIDIKKETIERIKDSGRVGRPKEKVRAKSIVYTFTIEYQDTSGTVRTFETSALDKDGNVTVAYLKFWPQYARVKSFSGMWGAFVILLVFGVILFFVSQMFNEKFFEKMKKKKRH